MLLYEDHKSLENTQNHKGCIYALAFSPDGAALVSGGKDGGVILREATGQRCPIIEREATAHPVHSVVYAADGSLIVGGAFGWMGYRQDPSGSWQVFGLPRTKPTNSLAMVDEHRLAVGIGDRIQATTGAFELWDLRTGKPSHQFAEPNGVRVVAACPAKRMAAWATGHRKIRIWEIIKQRPIEFPLPKPCVSLALRPDGTQFAAAVDYSVKVYSIEKGYPLFELNHQGPTAAVTYSPDGGTIATGSWDQTVKLWDATTGRERASFKWPIGRIYSLSYAPDGLRLAAGGDQGAVVVWDLE